MKTSAPENKENHILQFVLVTIAPGEGVEECIISADANWEGSAVEKVQTAEEKENQLLNITCMIAFHHGAESAS